MEVNTKATDIDALRPLCSAVRTNCDISDARHAADYTLCVYLLKMREFYRWEKGIAFGAALPHQDVTGWLSEREQYWDSLQNKHFMEIPLSGREFNPFDAGNINDVLNRLGYVYSSGIGRNMKPHFFLGTLEVRQVCNNYTVLVSGREYARDLTAPPAMSLDNTIYIRRESLRRMLWEKIEEWRWNKPANAMRDAISSYRFDESPEDALEEMTGNEVHSLLLHEIGEVMAGERLGEEWEELLANIPHSKAEIMVRAVRDNLADTLSTLPGLLEETQTASLHFYIANMTGMRKEIFPGLIKAYQTWNKSGNTHSLEQIIEKGLGHWQSVAEETLDIFRTRGSNCREEVVSLIETSHL